MALVSLEGFAFRPDLVALIISFTPLDGFHLGDEHGGFAARHVFGRDPAARPLGAVQVWSAVAVDQAHVYYALSLAPNPPSCPRISSDSSLSCWSSRKAPSVYGAWRSSAGATAEPAALPRIRSHKQTAAFASPALARAMSPSTMSGSASSRRCSTAASASVYSIAASSACRPSCASFGIAGGWAIALATGEARPRRGALLHSGGGRRGGHRGPGQGGGLGVRAARIGEAGGDDHHRAGRDLHGDVRGRLARGDGRHSGALRQGRRAAAHDLYGGHARVRQADVPRPAESGD